MAYKNDVRGLLKGAGYFFGQRKKEGQEIIPTYPISFGYPKGEGFGWITPGNHVTPDIDGNPHKQREWNRLCDILGIWTEHAEKLRIVYKDLLESNKEKGRMRRYRRMMGH